MFSVQRLSERVAEVVGARLSVEDFEDWFRSASWGHYDVQGDSLSNAIAAVYHVLHEFEADEIDDARIPGELAKAIRPFEDSDIRASSHLHIVGTGTVVVWKPIHHRTSVAYGRIKNPLVVRSCSAANSNEIVAPIKVGSNSTEDQMLQRKQPQMEIEYAFRPPVVIPGAVMAQS